MTTLVLEGAAATVAAPRPRPMVTRELLETQFGRLAAWTVRHHANAAFEAGAAACGDMWLMDALCEAVEALDDLAVRKPDAAPGDPDRVDAQAAVAYERALARVVDAAWATALTRNGGVR